MGEVTLTVQTSTGDVLYGPQVVQGSAKVKDLLETIRPAPPEHSWSFFYGSVKVTPESALSDFGEASLVLNASYSTAADKPPPKAS
ncbi:unnamed protein product [Effrenium voratum]|uniref:Uncharacterized protein n=1 Tax=Effrenium voratum TaxID=2562239 RepID=A0AA36JJ55_9DINO|nr:unnamed protein product [Effrenium voratum]